MHCSSKIIQNFLLIAVQDFLSFDWFLLKSFLVINKWKINFVIFNLLIILIWRTHQHIFSDNFWTSNDIKRKVTYLNDLLFTTNSWFKLLDLWTRDWDKLTHVWTFVVSFQKENRPVHQVAIDRPSPKFLSFLSKHYGLNEPLYQVQLVHIDYFG